MRKRPLAYVACVFLTGLVYQRYQKESLVLVITGMILWEIWSGRKAKNILKIAGRSVILLSAFLLGIFHMHREESFRDTYMSKVIDGNQVTVWGELIKTETTDYGVRGILTDCYVSLEGGNVPCNDVMVYFNSKDYRLGQIHKITGKMNRFSRARNQGNFDAEQYYQSLKIDFAMKEEHCEIYKKSSHGTRQMLLGIREKMASVYQNYMREKVAGFYQAMVLGDKTNLDEVLKRLFTIAGVSHILAISGLHVSIIGRGFYRLLRRGGVGFWIAGVFGGILLLLYSAMVGSSTSTMRAVGMLLLFFLSQGMGRSYDMLNALGAVVLLLLWETPFLIENTGFWFSVTALLGVGIVGKELSYSKKGSKISKCMSGFGMSLGITLATLPITALSYYEVFIYAPIVNFILLPVLSPIFVLALIGGVMGCLLPVTEVVAIFLKPCEWLLLGYEWICEITSRLPGAGLICGRPEMWQVIWYYILLFGGTFVLRFMKKDVRKESAKVRTEYGLKRAGVIVVTILVCVLCIFFPKKKGAEITFLDVGQGDGIYIRAEDGTQFFIDGGSSSVNKVGENRILPFLKSKQVGCVDYWFVSHCDIDHISGLLEILECGYKVEHIVLFEGCLREENYMHLLKTAKKAGTEVVYMKAGDKVCAMNFEISCITVKDSKNDGSELDGNEKSLVLLAEYKMEGKRKFKALFAGDISTKMENALCESGVIEDVDLLKANHHGSNYSNGERWFADACPEYIVVSCSENNKRLAILIQNNDRFRVEVA